MNAFLFILYDDIVKQGDHIHRENCNRWWRYRTQHHGQDQHAVHLMYMITLPQYSESFVICYQSPCILEMSLMNALDFSSRISPQLRSRTQKRNLLEIALRSALSVFGEADGNLALKSPVSLSP